MALVDDDVDMSKAMKLMQDEFDEISAAFAKARDGESAVRCARWNCFRVLICEWVRTHGLQG